MHQEPERCLQRPEEESKGHSWQPTGSAVRNRSSCSSNSCYLLLGCPHKKVGTAASLSSCWSCRLVAFECGCLDCQTLPSARSSRSLGRGTSASLVRARMPDAVRGNSMPNLRCRGRHAALGCVVVDSACCYMLKGPPDWFNLRVVQLESGSA